MTIQQAIEKAVEVGYIPSWHYRDSGDYHRDLLNPFFWQSLGKAMGLGTEMFHEDDGKTYWDFYEHCGFCGEMILDIEEGCPKDCGFDYQLINSWHKMWRDFIDHLAEGKDPESFFQVL
jgi:hypothetical protein